MKSCFLLIIFACGSACGVCQQVNTGAAIESSFSQTEEDLSVEAFFEEASSDEYFRSENTTEKSRGKAPFTREEIRSNAKSEQAVVQPEEKEPADFQNTSKAIRRPE